VLPTCCPCAPGSSLIVGFGDADVAGGLETDDRVEGLVGEGERARITPLNDQAEAGLHRAGVRDAPSI
jgi:hypothetical protein